MRHRGRRLAGGIAVGAIALVMFATEASAHVSIDTLGTVEQGSFAKLGFSVPNERDDAGTVKLTVQMPHDHPLAFVSVQPKQGWDIGATTRTLDTPIEAEGASISEVVDTVTWTAIGDTQIAPGQFDLFWISAGEMPTDTDQLAFPAIQTYSSGEEVDWIEPTPASGEEPEHPVPTVGLVAPSVEEGANATETDGDDDSNALTVIGLIVGGLGLVVGGLGFAMARSARKAATPG